LLSPSAAEQNKRDEKTHRGNTISSSALGKWLFYAFIQCKVVTHYNVVHHSSRRFRDASAAS
jgi:hypothetical protein